MAIILTKGKALKVPDSFLAEALLRALDYGSPDEPDGVDAMIHDILSLMQGGPEEDEDTVVVALSGDDWLEVEALTTVKRKELQDLTDTLENEEVARLLWERGAVEL